MINKIILSIISLVFKFLKFLSNILLLPLNALINGIFPDFSDYIEDFKDFFNETIFPGLGFAREVFINVTHFPRFLLGLAVLLITGVWTYRLGVHIFKFVLNVWKIFRKGETKD